MPSGKNQKLKLCYLSRIMLSKTDDEHHLTMPEIQELLAEYDVTADRKALYKDMDALSTLGIDVIGQKTKGGGYDYYVGSDDASDKILYKGWSEAFLAILTACSDDGSEYLSTVLDEFYWNYAYAFWQLDEDILDQICESYYSTKKEGTLLSIRELAFSQKVPAGTLHSTNLVSTGKSFMPMTSR